MKRNRHIEEQIISILKAGERGVSIAELARQNGGSEQTLYRRKAKYSGMEVSEAKRLRELDAENARFKRLLAESLSTMLCSRRSSCSGSLKPDTHLGGIVATKVEVIHGHMPELGSEAVSSIRITTIFLRIDIPQPCITALTKW